MHIVITGAGGFLGARLARRLAERGTLRGEPLGQLTLLDLAPPAAPEASCPVATRACDISDPAALAASVPEDADVIFHLAAVVSAHAEEVFEDGMAVNLTGTLNLLERCRALPVSPVLVYASSIAVMGGDVPSPIRDWTATTPQTSYGTQKAVGELLLNDYSRRGFVDGRGFRLPTISVRPGKPNRAASSFMSSIIREPLQGQEAVCPVGPDYAHYYLSPRRCIENLIRGAELPAEALGAFRVMQMPGRTSTIGEMVAAMTAVAGPEPARLIRWERAPEIEGILAGWRGHFEPERALALGLEADASFEENVAIFIEEELGGAPG